MVYEARRHIVLVGGGHAHVHVLERMARSPLPGARLTIVSPRPHTHYSGMIPGRLVGRYGPRQSSIDVAALAARAGAAFLADTACALDPRRGVLETAGHGEIPYDVLSLDVGSRPRGIERVQASANVIPVKPVDEAGERLARFLDEARSAGRGCVVVVGGGAAAIEVAFAVRRELPPRPHGRIVLVEAAVTLLPHASKALRRRVADLLPRYGVEARLGTRVASADADGVLLEDGTRIAAQIVVWATGAEGQPFLRESGLSLDPLGFVEVEDTLRSVTASEVFAAGDCARMAGHPSMARAGVFAVRQGPVLAENLRRQLAGRPLVSYRPQRDFLRLLSTGDGRAVVGYRGWAAHGRVWWRLKDWIDRRFVARYAPPAPGALRGPSEARAADPLQGCGGCAAKLPPTVLSRVLEDLAGARPPDVAVGLEERDDAAVLSVAGASRDLVFTIDAFPPFLGDLRAVGEVAAVNALSDVWAMGGRPIAAAVLACVGAAEGRAGEFDLRGLLLGARAGLGAAAVPLVGGHSGEAETALIGLAVLGVVRPEQIMSRAAACPGDVLVLTKPLGTGVILAASRAGECPANWTSIAVATMRRTNEAAARVLVDARVRACTDVSGFGLLGHACEMLRASRCSGEIWAKALPVLPGALELLARGWRSSADAALVAAQAAWVRADGLAPADPRWALARDPQTSGGLLAAVPPRAWARVVESMAAAGVAAVPIGRILDGEPGSLRLVFSATSGT